MLTSVNHKHFTTPQKQQTDSPAADHHPGEHEKEVVTYEDEILHDISETKVDTTEVENVVAMETLPPETDNTNLQNLKKLQTECNMGEKQFNSNGDIGKHTRKSNLRIFHEVEQTELAKREIEWKLNWKEKKRNNHGAANRLHKFKMAASHTMANWVVPDKMAAYTRIPDVLGRINNDRCSNPREKHKRKLLKLDR